MNTEELKRLAEAATPGPWAKREYVSGIGCGVDAKWNVALHASNDDAAYIAAANPVVVLELIRQRDELLSALKDAREMVEDWGSYASPYFQGKHDFTGDLMKLDAAIANVESKT